MTDWPEIKTAKALCAEGIIPCSEDKLRALAKTYGIGRKLGRAYVFTPADVAALVEKLPRPSPTAGNACGEPLRVSAGSAYERALALTSLRRRRPKSVSSP